MEAAVLDDFGYVDHGAVHDSGRAVVCAEALARGVHPEVFARFHADAVFHVVAVGPASAGVDGRIQHSPAVVGVDMLDEGLEVVGEVPLVFVAEHAAQLGRVVYGLDAPVLPELFVPGRGTDLVPSGCRVGMDGHHGVSGMNVFG